MREYKRSLTKEQLESMYLGDSLSISDIAKNTNMSKSGVLHLMTVYGIKRRTLSTAVSIARKDKKSSYLGRKQTPEEIAKRVETRKRNHAPQGVYDAGRGYLRFTVGPHAGRQVHDVIMEERIGRRLLPNECVHHINGDKRDNRIENLQLMTVGEHTSLHNNLRNSSSRNINS